MKENDYLLNILANPSFNHVNFKNVGLTTENTSFERPEVYKNLQIIQENPMFQTDGAFDEAKFNDIYEIAKESYNLFANNEVAEQIATSLAYRGNILVPEEERRKGYDTRIIREANPLRQKSGLYTKTQTDESPLSVREIAQTQKVWDPVTESWQDAPNDSWISNWTETRVLAQYDEDGEHEDPFTGKMVKHKKGDKKINHNGTFYYENLAGRDVYGREVLSKFDTLTRDGSWVNTFDFFDSDDKKKTFIGTLTKEAIKTIPALVGGPISAWYLGARVALNTAEMMTKFGKMAAGLNNKTLNEVEGYIKSLGFSKSDYAQGSSEANIAPHAWSLENFLSMGADTFLQLYEQRWIFNKVPSLFMGKAGYDPKAAEALKNAKLEEFTEKYNIAKRIQQGKTYKDKAKVIIDAQVLPAFAAQQAMNAYGKQYQQIGKLISQTYMTGITVQDTYREAIEEGADPWAAALLTLGYAAGEYAIINSDLGKWILPELKAQRMQMRQAVKVLNAADDAAKKAPSKTASVTDKMNWINKMLHKGREAAEKTYNQWGADLGKNIVSGALSEGFEELTEEVWYDLAKSIYNIGAYLVDSDHRLTTFDNVADRYGLSFVGGMLGGTIASVPRDFRSLKENKIMSKDQAWEYIVHEIKEDNGAELKKMIKNTPWASEALVAEGIDEKTGNAMMFDGTSGTSQNKAMQQQLINVVDYIDGILNANGAKVDDESLLSVLTNADKDFRFLALKNSTFAKAYLQDYNSLVTEIVSLSQQIEKLQNPFTDAQQRKNENDPKVQDQIGTLSTQLKQKLEEQQDFVNGKRAGEYIEKALFEMMDEVSNTFLDTNKVTWIESQEGKKIKEISPERLKVLEEKWNDWSAHKRKDDLEIAFRIFKAINLQASQMLQKYDMSYFQRELENKENYNIITTLSNVFGSRYAALNADPAQGEDFLKSATEGFGTEFDYEKSKYYFFADALAKRINDITSIEQLNSLKQLEPGQEQEQLAIDVLADLLGNDVAVDALIQDLEKLPYISYLDRTSLNAVIDIRQRYEDAYSEYGQELDEKASANIGKILNVINSKTHSPIMDLINTWSTSLRNSDIDVKTLLNQLETQYISLSAANKLGEFSMNDVDERRIKTILNNIKLLKAAVLAARTDGVDTINKVGYNVTVNELTQQGLAEIDKNNVHVILQDINKLEEKIRFYAKIHEINSGQKLVEHNKVAVNNSIITYNALKKFTVDHDWPPKEWEGAQELKDAITGEFEIIHTLDNGTDRTLSLGKVQRQSLQRDMQKIDKAFHEFFKKNQDILDDPKKLVKLFDPNLFNFKELDKSTLNKYTESMNDTQLVWWLATRAAIDPDSFYGTFKDSFINGIAPIAAQQQAIMTSVAAVLNNKVFHNFAKAYNLSLEEQAKDKEWFKKIPKYRSFSEDDYLDSDVAVNFFRHFLIEGIAGSGKTSAVAKEIVAILGKSDAGKELLSNVWFVHTTKEEAQKWAENIGFGKDYANAFSREEYLEKIAPGVGKMRKITDEGLKLNKLDLVQRPGESLYHYNIGINKGLTSNIPSLVMMDEVSGFSQQDLLLSEDFSNYYGHSNLVFGDFDQDGLEGVVKQISKGFDLNSQIFRGNFAGASKLGDSLRTTNGVKDHNNKEVQSKIDVLKQGEGQNKGISLNLKWYTDGNVILGDKAYRNHNNLEAIKADIIKLLDNVPEYEQLGYVYNDKTSPIYQWLSELNADGKYKGKINFKEGSSSQGQEADFYVVDLKQDSVNTEATTSKFWRQVYTGITRARRGTISIINDTGGIVQEHKPSEEIAGEFSLKPEAIQSFSEETKTIYDSVYDKVEPLVYKRFQGERKVNTVMINGETYTVLPNRFDVSKSFEYEKNTHTFKGFVSDGTKEYVWTNSGADNLYEINDFKNNILSKIKGAVQEDVSVQEAEERQKLDEKNSKDVDIINDNESELHMLLHSFATNETGLIEEDGKYKVSLGWEDRIDGVYGIMRLLGIKPSSDGEISKNDYRLLQNILQPLRSSALYSRTKEEIISSLQANPRFGQKFKNPHVQLIFKSHYMPGKNPKSEETEEEYYNKPSRAKYKRWIKSIKEKVTSLFTKKGVHVEPTQKTISLLVTDYDGKNEKAVLEIPLVNLTNPLTMLNTDGFKEVKEIADDIQRNFEASGEGYTGKTLLEKIRDKIKASSEHVKMSESFLKLADLYLEVYDNSVVLLDDIISEKYKVKNNDLITLSNIFEPTGLLITNKAKGQVWYDKDTSYDGQWISLTDYRNMSEKVVSNIYAAAKDVIDPNTNEVIVEAGHYFVLVTDAVHKFKGLSDEELIDAFYKQNQDKNNPKYFKLVRVTPPTSNVEDYFENLESVYHKNQDTDSTIGTINTAFDILSYLLEDDVLKDKVPSVFHSNYEQLKEQVSKIKELKDKLSSKEFIELLKSDGEVAGKDLKTFTKDVYGSATHFASWKTYLQNQLRWLVLADTQSKYNFSPNPETESQKFIADKIQIVKEYLATKNINGIFYSPPLDVTRQEYKGLIPIDNKNGTFKSKPFMINGKIDSQAYKGNVLPLIEGLLDAYQNIDEKGFTEALKNTETYRKDNFAIYAPNPNLAKKQAQREQQEINNRYKAIEKQINKQSDLVKAKSLILEAVKNNKAITLQELEKLLLDQAYYARILDDNTLYIKDDKDVTVVDRDTVIKDGIEYKFVDFGADGAQFKAVIKGNSTNPFLSKVLDKNYQGQLDAGLKALDTTKPPIQFTGIINTDNINEDIINAFKIYFGDVGVDSVQDIESFIDNSNLIQPIQDLYNFINQDEEAKDRICIIKI